MIKMILCSNKLGGIGKDNRLIYNIPGDMEFFKKMTTGYKVVMGYKTWESLPKKPLPNRINCVLTRTKNIDNENVKVIRSIDDIIEMGKRDDIFIIGGAQLYNELLERNAVDEVYLTLVNDESHDFDVKVRLGLIVMNLPKKEIIKTVEDEKRNIIANFIKYSK